MSKSRVNDFEVRRNVRLEAELEIERATAKSLAAKLDALELQAARPAPVTTTPTPAHVRRPTYRQVRDSMSTTERVLFNFGHQDRLLDPSFLDSEVPGDPEAA